MIYNFYLDLVMFKINSQNRLLDKIFFSKINVATIIDPDFVEHAELTKFYS